MSAPTKDQVVTAQRFVDLHRNHPAITTPNLVSPTILEATVVNTYIAALEVIQESLAEETAPAF